MTLRDRDAAALLLCVTAANVETDGDSGARLYATARDFGFRAGATAPVGVIVRLARDAANVYGGEHCWTREGYLVACLQGAELIYSGWAPE